MLGSIHCRLASNTAEIGELGRFIKNRSWHDRDPFFLILEDCRPAEAATQILITSNVLDHIIRLHKFWMGSVSIELTNKLAKTEMKLRLNEREMFYISGFPRSLFQDEKQTAGMILLHSYPDDD